MSQENIPDWARAIPIHPEFFISVSPFMTVVNYDINSYRIRCKYLDICISMNILALIKTGFLKVVFSATSLSNLSKVN